MLMYILWDIFLVSFWICFNMFVGTFVGASFEFFSFLTSPFSSVVEPSSCEARIDLNGFQLRVAFDEDL